MSGTAITAYITFLYHTKGFFDKKRILFNFQAYF